MTKRPSAYVTYALTQTQAAKLNQIAHEQHRAAHEILDLAIAIVWLLRSNPPDAATVTRKLPPRRKRRTSQPESLADILSRSAVPATSSPAGTPTPPNSAAP